MRQVPTGVYEVQEGVDEVPVGVYEVHVQAWEEDGHLLAMDGIELQVQVQVGEEDQADVHR